MPSFRQADTKCAGVLGALSLGECGGCEVGPSLQDTAWRFIPMETEGQKVPLGLKKTKACVCVLIPHPISGAVLVLASGERVPGRASLESCVRVCVCVRADRWKGGNYGGGAGKGEGELLVYIP